VTLLRLNIYIFRPTMPSSGVFFVILNLMNPYFIYVTM
jgi:hypothetical protein